jgi:hypothetical protein
MKAKRLLVTILVLALLAGGCSGGTGTTTASPTATVAPDVIPEPTPTSLPTSMPTHMPPSTSTPTPTPTPTLTPTPTPSISAEELQEKWRIPLYATALTVVSYEGLFETAEQLQAGELDSWGALGQLLGAGIVLSSTRGLIAQWDPAPDQADYQVAMQECVNSAGEVIGRWFDSEISSEDVPGLIQEDYDACQELMEEIMRAMQDDGLARDDIEAMLDELAEQMEEAMSDLEMGD